jgi:hypothetical protein
MEVALERERYGLPSTCATKVVISGVAVSRTHSLGLRPAADKTLAGKGRRTFAKFLRQGVRLAAKASTSEVVTALRSALPPASTS